jgi:hypothetical protein
MTNKRYEKTPWEFKLCHCPLPSWQQALKPVENVALLTVRVSTESQIYHVRSVHPLNIIERPYIHLNSPFMGYPQCFMWKEVASKHIHCVHLLYFYAFSIFPVDSLTKVKKKDIVVKNYMRGEQSIMSF